MATALHAPLWSFQYGKLLGVTDDGRIAAVEGLASGGGEADTALSAPLADMGRNIEISPLDESTLLVPQPRAGSVARLDIADLSVTDALDAGPEPDVLALDSGSRTLLSLSADASTVTPVDLHRDRLLPATRVDARPGALVQGAARGRQLDFHVVDDSAVTHYQGVDPPVGSVGRLTPGAAAVAGDRAKVSRVYIGPAGTGKVLAVDSDSDGKGLKVVGTADLGEDVQFLATDDTRIYAVTDRRVVVLETHSFDGYAGSTIPVIRDFDYRAALSGEAKDAPVAGVTVAAHRVFLTFSGAPWVVGVAKPRV
ncbi:hypothetical protein ABEU20_000646 [Rhodococcus sp. PAM 2766]|uniref:Uncharacterized protein n=1 Tax=Rhodococcus parequi TaxID=3137122 RepID=A0ABW9F9C3_9NOCA